MTHQNDQTTAQSYVQGTIDALVSFWPEIREDDAIAPEIAFPLLADWSHLQRFDPATLDTGLVRQLNTLVESDAELLGKKALAYRSLQNWGADAEQLDEAWDSVVDADEIYELEREINKLWHLLDNGSLVAFAVVKLKLSLCDDEQFQAYRAAVESAEVYLAENPDVFLPDAVLASGMLDAYRPDLHEVDAALWDTTLKHRSLQELLEEQDHPPRLDGATSRLFVPRFARG